MKYCQSLAVFLIFMLLNSCSSSQPKEQLDINDNEVVTKFGLSSDLLERFSTKKMRHIPKSKATSNRKKKTVNYSKKLKKTKKNILKKKDGVKQEAVKIDSTKKVSKDVVDSEYPEKFRALDILSKPIWSRYKENIYIGEKAVYKMKYIGVTAGYITLKTDPLTSLNGVESYHFKALVKTASFYSLIYWLNDTLNSYVARTSFLPLKYILSQREKKQDIDDLQLFDREKLKTMFLYRKVKKGRTTKKNIVKPIPYYFQDSFSSIYFLRGLNLQVGDKIEYPIVNKAKYWILKMKVIKRETIDIMGKNISAFKVAAETKFPGALKKSGDIFFWFAADTSRRLLRFEGKVKIGSIHGELVKFSAGKKL